MLWIFQEIVSKGKEKMADIEELHEYFVKNMKDKVFFEKKKALAGNLTLFCIYTILYRRLNHL